jgi:hypothetical protein
VIRSVGSSIIIYYILWRLVFGSTIFCDGYTHMWLTLWSNFLNLLQAVDLTASSKEIRDLTRIERIGAHSHIRGRIL